MCKIIVMANQKGGVAKTSSTRNLAYSLAELGKKYDNMLVMTADVDTSSRIQAFKEKYPDRCYQPLCRKRRPA